MARHEAEDVAKLERRVSWLNSNVFNDSQIDKQTVRDLLSVSMSRRYELLREVEDQARNIRDPNDFLKTAVERDANRGGGGSNGRAARPPPRDYDDRPINRKGKGGGRDDDDYRRRSPRRSPVRRGGKGKDSGKGKSKGKDEDRFQVHRKVTWLNNNVFTGCQIHEDTVDMILELGVRKAFDMLNEVEAKADQVRNPGNWLKKATARVLDEQEDDVPIQREPKYTEHRSWNKSERWSDYRDDYRDDHRDDYRDDYRDDRGKGKGKRKGKRKSDEDADFSRIHKRATWLNGNVFTDSPIDEEAIEMLYELGVSRAYDLFKEVEESADDVSDPSEWLKQKAGDELGYNRRRGKSKGSGKGKGKGDDADYSKLHKRATWLSKNIFVDCPIDEEAIEMLFELGMSRALELLDRVEALADEVDDPGEWLMEQAEGAEAPAERGGSGRERGRSSAPPPPPPAPPKASAANRSPSPISRPAAGRRSYGEDRKGSKGKGKGKGKGKSKSTEEEDYIKVHRRATWLNKNVFQDSSIDEEAIDMMFELGVPRAMQLFEELEEKAADIDSPGEWLKETAYKEIGASSAPGSPRRSTGKRKAVDPKDERDQGERERSAKRDKRKQDGSAERSPAKRPRAEQSDES
eukprot:TRINITY_DN2603_c0_g1_i1.p1 TRINITY_DN2603_c0_g1~~TRINITY_DN2603_c0_g1_i1.p1  ORF type:complete len:633 (+),score=155.10 TRINITY_DN2603_c0_g1_i1:48-1946(+)